MRRLMPSVPMILILGGCATPGEKTAIGAGAGAAVGAGVGALAGGWEGAAIGAVVGGVAGGAIGNYLDKQAQELQQVANARRTETGILVNLKSSLLFSSDSAVLQPAAVEQLAQLGDILARYPEDRIVIQGHTDSTGSAAHDEELSLRRAAAILGNCREAFRGGTCIPPLPTGPCRRCFLPSPRRPDSSTRSATWLWAT